MARDPWFAQKSLGYGAGAPVHWKGWAALILFAVAFTAALYGFYGLVFLGSRFEPQWLGLTLALLGGVLLVVPVLAGFVALARARTRGGWRMNYGDGTSSDQPPPQ